MSQTPVILLLPSSVFLAYRQGLVDIYRLVFSQPPYNEPELRVQQYAAILKDHVKRPGFRGAIARLDGHGQLVGFAYGYQSRPGQWWYDETNRQLDAQTATHWLANAFELVELAVHPAHQGQGFGGALHDRLLQGLPQRTAVLSTAAEETAATHLYRKRGWQQLCPPFQFPGLAINYIIMGIELSAFRDRQSGKRK